MTDEHEPIDWYPATHEPGEIYTPEGRIRAAGAFARGLKEHDPRLRAYRREMRRSALQVSLLIVAVVIVVAVLATVLDALL